MAIELVSCPACGRKNASDRTACLSCGADLPISNESEQKEVSRPWVSSLWQRLNVWQRLWIFLSVLWFVVVAFFTFGEKEPQYLFAFLIWIVPYIALNYPNFFPVSVVAFLSWAVPCIMLYAVGWAIDGVRRGFQKVDTPRRPSRAQLRLTPWWRGWLRVAIVGYFVSWPLTSAWLTPSNDTYSADQILSQLYPAFSVSKDAWPSVIARPEFLQLNPDERKRLAAEHFDRKIAPWLSGTYWKREPFRSQFIEASALSLEEMPIKQWYNPGELSRPIPYRDINSQVRIDMDLYRLYRDTSIRALIFELGVLVLMIPLASASRPVVSRFKISGMIKQVGSRVRNLTLEQATKIAILGSTLLIAFSVFYYFVIHLPQREAALLQLQKEEKAAKEFKEAQEQAAREQEKWARESELENCLLYARADYEKNWANSCKARAERQRRGLQDCFSSGLRWNYCNSLWRPANDSPDCSLPQETARRWDDSLKEAKDECYKKYPQR